MIPKLREAFQKAEALSDAEQEALAQRIIDMVEAEERSWDDLFSRPAVLSAFDRLAQEALAEHRRGETKPLDPDTL